MSAAIEEAELAARENEVPVGAVIVSNDRIIARAHNTCEQERDFTAHAELNAIRLACKKKKSAYLTGCTLYVTMEPCAMCMGAIIASRLSVLVYGTPDFALGCAGGKLDLFFNDTATTEIYTGISEKRCSELLSEFFDSKRKKDNEPKEKEKEAQKNIL